LSGNKTPRPERFLPGLLIPTGIGVLLRLHRLGEQLLGGDELHAVRAALARPVGTILTTYQTADPCLPLAALYRFLMDRGVQPSEWTFRWPVLLFALATPLVLPLVARHSGWLERRGAMLLAWLLALSPLLVLYGRIVRPYGIVVPLASVAVIAFYRFQFASGLAGWNRWRWGVLYAAATASTLYLNLATAPLLAAPFLFMVAEKVWKRQRGGWLPPMLLGAGTTALVAAFLLPAWGSFTALLAAKGGTGSVQWEGVASAFLLLAGTPYAAVAALFWVLAVAGSALLIRQHRRLGLYLLTLVVGHLVGLAILSPFGIDSPAVFVRYLLVALPILLLWVAYALARVWERGLPGGPAVAVGLVLGLFLCTPLARPSWWATSFLHHADTLRFDRPLPTVAAAALPTPYGALAVLPPGPILEAPVRTPWRFARAVYAYQRHHRRRVLLLSDDPHLCDPRLALQNHACGPGEAFQERGAVAILVHMDPMAEEQQVSGPPAARDRRGERVAQQLRTRALQLAQRLEAERGPPTVAGGGVALWEMSPQSQDSPHDCVIMPP